MTTNKNMQKKQNYFCIKQNKYISKKHREKKEKTRTTNLNDFSPPFNFCAAGTQGKRLCVPAIATMHNTLQRFLLEKTQKRPPRGTLSSN